MLDSTCSANEYSSVTDTFKIDHGKWARTILKPSSTHGRAGRDGECLCQAVPPRFLSCTYVTSHDERGAAVGASCRFWGGCVLTLVTCAFVVFSDRFVPLRLLWVETVVIVGVMAVLAYRERRALPSR